ncbi:unnamed protein product [Orchesella dallaii]|uniref:Uncharacterized protein n=1 Tax=Orchesella dallaii TaxID=48710 RepID=A0ABP1PUZ6_9HEXA
MGSLVRSLRLLRPQSQQLLSRSYFPRPFSNQQGQSQSSWNWGALRNTVAAAVGAGTTVYLGWHLMGHSEPVLALKPRKKEDEIKAIKLTSRERRFLRFASVEYDGQLYMTPQDFLESVVEAEPRPRLKRKALNKNDLQNIKDSTPPLQKGSPQMFRNLRDKGINNANF